MERKRQKLHHMIRLVTTCSAIKSSKNSWSRKEVQYVRRASECEGQMTSGFNFEFGSLLMVISILIPSPREEMAGRTKVPLNSRLEWLLKSCRCKLITWTTVYHRMMDEEEESEGILISILKSHRPSCKCNLSLHATYISIWTSSSSLPLSLFQLFTSQHCTWHDYLSKLKSNKLRLVH